MRLVGLLFLLWGAFGVAVVLGMVYGAFDHVAMTDAVMAGVLATGTAFLGAIGSFAAWHLHRQVTRR